MKHQKGGELETIRSVEMTKLYSPELNINKDDIYKEMYPVLFTLSVFGINFHKRFILFCRQFDRREIAWSTYSMIVLLLVATNVCRWLGNFQNRVHMIHKFLYSITALWSMQCMVHFIAFFIESTMLSQFRKFVTAYHKYIDKYKIGVSAAKTNAYVFVVIYCIVVLSLTTLDACMYYEHMYGDYSLRWPFKKRAYFVVAVDVMNTTVITYLYAIWFGIPLITCYISSCLRHEYEIINVEIVHLYEKESDSLYQQLESFRLRHLEVCRLIKKFDGFFWLHLTVDVTCTLAVSFLQLYVIIWDTTLWNHVTTTLTSLSWFCFALGKVLLQIYFASLLNEAVSG